MAPVFEQAVASAGRWIIVHLSCPDCWQDVDLRFLRPEAGGWYLRLQERLAAGRTWGYRFEGSGWVASP